MNPTQHVTTLRQTHRAATMLLPVLTATLTVAGAVIATMEARTPHAGAQAHDGADELANAAGSSAGGEAVAGARVQAAAGRVTVRGYIATLAGRMLMVALGIALVLALVYLATATGRVGQAITLTSLILLTLYLTEKVARRR